MYRHSGIYDTPNNSTISTKLLHNPCISHYLFLLPSRVQGYRDGSDVLQTFEMQVPAAYYCSEGCGGGLAPDNNGTIYYWNYGECTGQDNCV